MNNGFEIIKTNHPFSIDYYLKELSLNKSLIYLANHTYEKGHEYLASNEFDWHKSFFDPIKTDSVIGFGTNSLWDIALHNQAQSMVVADWSPWPLIAHAFLLKPLMLISKSPQEFIFMISGLPPKYSAGLSLEEAFAYAKHFTLSPLGAQKSKVSELLMELAANPKVSEIELKFLTTFFRPRLGDNLNPQNGFGPFYDLKSPNIANFTYYFEQRYNPQMVGQVSSTLSSLENFNYVKSLFSSNKVFYALSNIIDSFFYLSVLQHPQFEKHNHVSISFSNIFDCGYYNQLDLEEMNKLLMQLKPIFQNKEIYIYRTLNRNSPHTYLRERFS